jgi:transposase
MAQKTIQMVQLKQLCRLIHQAKGDREIARVLNISRPTVKKYRAIINAKSINYESIQMLSDYEIVKLLEIEPSNGTKDKQSLDQLFTQAEKKLKQTGVTRDLIWQEYINQNPDGYSYTRFCELFQKWRKASEVSMHLEHKAGDKLYVDFAGENLEIVDKQTGEIIAVEVFAGILGASQLTYVEACFSQRIEDFVRCVENNLHYLQGVPLAIVPDNLKSAVTAASKYEPIINQHFEDFANHYGCVIVPARAYKPRDKALVEGVVKIIYTRIYTHIRRQTWFSLQELNQAIKELLEIHNNTNFQGRSYSRRILFEEIEKQVLNPLPQGKYHLKQYAVATVQKTSHILLGCDKHYYSVPYSYISKKIKIAYTSSVVEIYYNSQRIALHKRDLKPFSYTTLKEHMPSSHQFVSDWNPEKFIRWAEAVGTDTTLFITKLLEIKTYPEQSYKACMGVLQMAKKTGNERLNNACKRACDYGSYSYASLKKILQKGLDKIEVETLPIQTELPLHENVRGKEYYQ